MRAHRNDVYRARRSRGKAWPVILWILAGLIVLAVILFFAGQKYIVYDSDGSLHVVFPIMETAAPVTESGQPETVDTELVLEDPEHVLDSGIEIKVQPPGKALSTLSLMSGGEMAFVAIALYFAILKVRPTPFCVMDEIEAALDEANVTRYVQYMRRLAKNTQFLVITHRRGTMEEADHLFGVTMQEKGVSRVIELSLDEAAKTIS